METKKTRIVARQSRMAGRSKVSSGGLIDNGQWLDSGMLRDDPSPLPPLISAPEPRSCWSAIEK